MRKSLLLSFLCLFCVMVTHAEKQTWSISSWSSNLKLGENTLNGKKWTTECDNTNVYIGRNSTTYNVLGAKDNPTVGSQSFEELTFKSSDFGGAIYSISIKANITSGAEITAYVYVGEEELDEAWKISNTSAATHEFKCLTDGLHGNIKINFKGNSNQKQLHLYSITVTYDPDFTNPNLPTSPTFSDEDGNAITLKEYTVHTTTGATLFVSSATEDAAVSVTGEPENAFTYENGKIIVYDTCTLTATATNSYGSSSHTLKVIVDKSPAAPVFFNSAGNKITDKTYTFTSLSDTSVKLTYESDATCSVVAYAPGTTTELDGAISDLTDDNNGNVSFTVSKACTIVATATRDGLSTSSEVTFYGPKPLAPEFYDTDFESISGNVIYSATDEQPNYTFYVALGDNTTGYTYEAANPSAVDKVEEVKIDGKDYISFELNASTSITVTATNNFESTAASISVSLKKYVVFERVTDENQIRVGGQYVIVNATSGSPVYSLTSTPNSSNGGISAVSDPLSFNADGTLNVEISDVAVFTLEEGKEVGKYLFKYLLSGRYLTCGSSSTSFNSSTDNAAANAQATISQGENSFATITFSENKRLVYFASAKNGFRPYSADNYKSNVYLYQIPINKEEVEIEWVNNAYTLDADFGWEGDAPELMIGTEGLTAESLGIVYSSSHTEVATISKSGEIKFVGVGETVIIAEIPASNVHYKAEPTKFTLTTKSAGLPVFTSVSGEAFETNEVSLFPSELAAGYTVKVKAPEGYGLNVTVSPAGAGTVTYTETGAATVTVKADCSLTARTKKGDQTSTRYASFRIRTKDLAPAEISWTANQYVYDLAKKQWNTEPELVNHYDLPVTYNSNNENVARINAYGKIVPVAQGSAIVSANVAGTDDYSGNTVTTSIRVTDSSAPMGYDVFELVHKGDQLRENEQFIIVSGEPFNSEVKVVGQHTKEGGKYYAISPYVSPEASSSNLYYSATAIDFPEGDESGERLLVSDEADVLRLSKQFDTSAKDANYPFLFQVMNDIDDIQGRYIQVQKEKEFTFVELPANVEDRGAMNGNVRVLDPGQIEGYKEEDYNDIYVTSVNNNNINYSSTKSEFLNKGEIIFNGTDGYRHYVRFNPTGKAIHFNVYKLDSAYDSITHSKSGTFPVRIYRLANRVEKPSITVYPEEPVKSDIAYQEGVTYNNKVRVVIEQHPKTSPEASLMRQWQKEGRNPALPDYDSFKDNQVVVYVDGHVVVDENDEVIRYIDPELNDATATRALFAVSCLDDVYSESAQAIFNFKASAPRVSKFSTEDNGDIKVRISRPTSYTKDAQYFYVISEDGSKPSVTFNQDGTVKASTGDEVAVWTGDSEDTTSGIVTLPQGQTLWVGSFKAGYQPTVIEYTNNTVFPECRPMQLLRLTDKGREIIVSQFESTADIFDDNAYDASKPLYINYRNDLVNEEDGTIADSDHHFHYLIQRDHDYGDRTNRQVEIRQISEAQFESIFGDNAINVDDEHAKNFLWTSDYYVFALNMGEFGANFASDVTINNVKVVTGDRTYTALENKFDLRPTNTDGTYVQGQKAESVYYYGAMLENQGTLGAKTLTTVVNYTVDGKEYTTETSAETSPRIPSSFGFTYEYQYEREEESALKKDNPDAEFVKLSVPSAIAGKGNSDVLIPINDLNNRHLNLVFKFNRPNISKHILQEYDIYYTIKFNRVDTSNGEPVRTLLEGSGVYVDNEIEEGNDAVYRFRIDDVNPTSAINPEIEISKVTYVGNSNDEIYGQYVSNFGDQKTVGPAPNNSERKPLSISELWITKTPNREVDGKEVADWMYLGHSDMQDTPDIIINNPNSTSEDQKQIEISSSYYHIETYIPDTEYYSSYEYLVKHDDVAHNTPSDLSHPFYSDEILGYAAGQAYDALRYTIIARDFPTTEDAKHDAIIPRVVISPVYFFAYGADMKPMPIDKDNNKIDYYEQAGGFAQITYVNALSGAVSPTKSRAKAPRRAAGTGSDAPSTKEYPMAHAGDTDMNHESILDLSNDPAYTVAVGGHYEPDDDAPIMTGIENLVNDRGTNDGKETFYNLQGVKVSNPGHGFYIRVNGGKATKVMR